jgi:hypothetical protein
MARILLFSPLIFVAQGLGKPYDLRSKALTAWTSICHEA